MRISNETIDRIYCNSTVRPTDSRMAENHSHNYYEIFYVSKGNARFFVDDRLFDLHAGDFMIIPPNLVHYNRYLMQTSRVNIYFREEDVRRGNNFVLKGLKEQFLEKPAMFHTPSSYRDLLDTVLNTMIHEDPISDENTGIMLQLLLQEFFVYSRRYCIINPGYSSQITQGDDITIQQAAQYISENYNLPITLDFLARKSGLSPAYFSKRFHFITGMGMKEYLTYVRLKHAEAELLSTSHSIAQIAENTGFSDSNYFKDVFKNKFGLSPRAYRKTRKTDLVDARTRRDSQPAAES
ncbi:MAG: helix-turn-helix domain-containing protein [Solobacterium sp.]|nr:helix-turn-helix domain-containing protein [Solobacterium sp.]